MQLDNRPPVAAAELKAPAGMADAATFPPGTGPMAWFDQIRALCLRNGLSPEPAVYDLFWRYVRDEDHQLSLAIDRAMAAGRIDMTMVVALRRDHCGDLAGEEVAALVATAHDQAAALTTRIESGREDLADYGRQIADGGARLAAPLDAAGLAQLLDQLAAATATMQAANARLAGELATAAQETLRLAERLTSAERAAVTDALTGVLNRRGTLEAVARHQADTRGRDVPLALAVIDIDHFKRLNDRFGHGLGDEVLRFIARHIADRLAAQGGQIGRLGGEEFVALLPGQPLAQAAAAIDRVRAELAAQIIRSTTDGASMGRVTFSAGVAADRPEFAPDHLIDRADQALYLAKRMGRDRVVPDRG